MKDLILLLEEIDTDFYKGVYTIGERFQIVRAIDEAKAAEPEFI